MEFGRKWQHSDFSDTDFVVVFFVTLNYNDFETYLFAMKLWLCQLEVISSPQELPSVTGKFKQNGLTDGYKFIISYYNCQVLPSLNKVLLHSTEGNFPLSVT